MKKIFSYLIYFALIPLTVIVGSLIFENKQYAWISFCIALLTCVPFFISYEKQPSSALALTLIAAMTAVATSSRILFVQLPAIKPVSALVIITGMYFGAQAGFLTGAFTALISNFYFGQGPWTPFQMCAWGLIGLFAGILSKYLKKSLPLVLGFGALAGVLFSVVMDIWTVLWWDGTFNVTRYFAAVVSSLNATAAYTVSNVIFLLMLSKPLGKTFERIKSKYMYE